MPRPCAGLRSWKKHCARPRARPACASLTGPPKNRRLRRANPACRKAGDGVARMTYNSTAPPLLQKLGYLPEKATARALGMHEETLVKRRKAGRAPPHIVLKRAVYYRQCDLEAWVLRGEGGRR